MNKYGERARSREPALADRFIVTHLFGLEFLINILNREVWRASEV